ncbi:hypothetical protein Mal64_28810 [Pseudobythopirellula maris]|uniref:Putative restriction endonuclease domain-containing protein n=1 Tax=Pseudobythopirellula maris TaxID=2527991 RepID=A0A5C5ZIX3_9BACT|nr:Uma2 family endonuclease [Pseudobythopirellula maris]TWT87342.1 hypothetical protein Mal64_28810 [Pseudobythopirellula maris]
MASADLATHNAADDGEPFDPTLIRSTVILDPQLSEEIRRQRAECGSDRFDEVWDGVYMMSPLANNEHQEFGTRLAAAIQVGMGFDFSGTILAGVNVSDRSEEWTVNFRIPDVAVYLPTTEAVDRGAFWQGGPDFAVEIVSKHDRAREKIDFYAKVGTRELMFVDRDPWRIELLRLVSGRLVSVGESSLNEDRVLASEVIPFAFRLIEGETRPRIEVTHSTTRQNWNV